MRRALAVLARLYPRCWRERYGPEFDALMEDVPPDFREFIDILRGAVVMQLSNRTAYVKLAAIMAVIGAIAAAGFAFRSPAHYTSTATLRMDPPKDASLPKDYGPRLAATQVELMRQEILSRSSLAEMIQRPSLNLYRAERYRLPMEDIIQRMRRDIRVSAAAGNDGGPVTLEVSFTYPDRVKAQAVVREVTTRFNEQNFAVNRNRALLWRNAWQEAAPPGPTLQVLSSASDPAARGPDYFVWAAAGALSGLLLGLLAVSLRRQPARTFQLAGCAFAGFGLAGAASYYFVDDTYTSTAVMRMIEPLDPKRWYPGQPHVPVSGRIQQLEQNVLSLANLQKLILRPSLDLYVARRRASPIEQVAADMRDRSIRIEMLPKQLGSASGDAFRISFRYYDRFKTQAVVRELVTGFVESNFVQQREKALTADEVTRKMMDYKLGEVLEVLDPASLPQAPDGPNRLLIACAGLTAGLLLGIVLLWRRPPGLPMPQSAPLPA